MNNNLRLAFVLAILFCAQARGQSRKPEVVVQSGHTDVVMSLAFSPDGRICASGSRDRTIKLWDARTGHLLRTLKGHEGRVTRMVFSSDGQVLVSASVSGYSAAESDGDDTNILWQVETGRILVQTSVGPFALSPDGQTFAGVADDQLKLWDAHTGQLRATLAKPAVLASLTFSPDSRLIAAGTEVANGITAAQVSRTGKDAHATVWDTRTGRALFNLEGGMHTRFSPDGKFVYDDAAPELFDGPRIRPPNQARYDGMGRVYSAADGHLLRTVGGALIAFAPVGQSAVRWDGRQMLDVVDLASGQTLHSFAGYAPALTWRANGTHVVEAARPVRFSPAGGLLALEVKRVGQKQDEPQVELWDTRTWRQLQLPTGRHIYSISSDDSYLVLGNEIPAPGEDEPQLSYELWSAPDMRLVRQIGQPFSYGGGGASEGWPLFSPADDLLAVPVGTDAGVYTLPDGALARYLRGDSGAVSALVFSADGRQFALMKGAEDSPGRRYELWDVREGSRARVFTPPPSALAVDSAADSAAEAYGADSYVNFSADEEWFVTGDHQFINAQGRTVRTHTASISLGRQTYVQFHLDATHVDLRDLKTGRLRRRFSFPSMVNAAVSPDDRLLAISGGEYPNAHVAIYDSHTGQLLRNLVSKNVDSLNELSFSPNSHLLAVGESYGKNHISSVINLSTGRWLEDSSGVGQALAFSPDSRMIVLEGDNCDVEEDPLCAPPAPQSATVDVAVPSNSNAIVLLQDAYTGKLLKVMRDESYARALSAAFTPDGKVLAVGCDDTTVKLFSTETGEQLATLLSFADSGWLVITPDGLFDGSPDSWNQMLWRFSNRLFDVAPVEWFFNDFFYPGLLADVLAGRRPRATTVVAAKDRRQPELHLAPANNEQAGAALEMRTINLRITITEGAPDETHEQGSGARDVRLFRNGSLVRVWHDDVLGVRPRASDGRREVILEATDVPVVAGENRFTVYAFNHDNIKSADAVLSVRGAESLRRSGTAYIVTIGLNRYENAQYDLKYAVADAQVFGAELQRQFEGLKAYSRVEVIPLFDEAATKPRIMATLSRLAQAAQPEDAVIIYFSGHGTAHRNQFYLLPHDLGYRGSRTQLDEAGLQIILDHGVSDGELAQAFERIDARQQLLIIDACNSGQALESEEKRRGPMNSKGLAQLAYEKGMYVLTAAQSYQAALEAAQLGHGLLTYALVAEGLQHGAADLEPKDRQVWARELLDYVTARVPQM